MLPRATDRGSVRAGWELLGCKMKARPPSTGISEETLNERGRREVTGVHSFRYFVSCQPSQLILLLPSSSLLPTPPQVPKPSFKSQGVGGILTVSPPGGGSSPVRVVALPVAKVQADSRAPPPVLGLPVMSELSRLVLATTPSSPPPILPKGAPATLNTDTRLQAAVWHAWQTPKYPSTPTAPGKCLLAGPLSPLTK